MSLYCNAVCSFANTPIIQIKGFSCHRGGSPDYSAADLSNCITYVAVKQRIDILSLRTLDASILMLTQGMTGVIEFTAKTADGTQDLVFSGPATVLEVTGDCEFAEVETMKSITFAVISADGQVPNLTVG